MKAYYVQVAGELTPIFGVSSLEEALEFVSEEDRRYVVESEERVYMHPHTGSVDIESGWDGDTEGLEEVRFCAEQEAWVQA